MTNPISYELISNEGAGIAVITVDNPPVNASGHAVRLGLLEAVKTFSTDDNANIAVIVGAGKTFIAGADIHEFGKPLAAPDLADVVRQIDILEKPIICSLHGTALGGGLEIALACHYRIALNSTKIGLPEVSLGLIPGAGGTQRLPRLTGIEIAANIISTGRHVLADEALAIGILDHLDDGNNPKEAGITFAKTALAKNLPVRRTSDSDEKIKTDQNDADLFKRMISEATEKAKGQVSPVACVEAVISTTNFSFPEGLVAERQKFDDLIETDQSKSLIHMFFADRQVNKIPELKSGTPRHLDTAAVIGGGTMGSGIAVALLYAGYSVIMIERDDAGAARGRETVNKLLDAGVKRGKIDSDKRDHFANTAFSVSSDITAISSAELIIEAAFEDMEVKKELFKQVDIHAKKGAVLASNTSFLDVNELAAVTSRPEDVLGLHFFSPAHIMKLLEVVVTDSSHDDVVATGFSLAKRLKKVAVRSKVCDGFIGNRILDHYLNLVTNLVEDGTSPYDIDQAVVEMGFPMGPHQMLDLAGLDIVYANRQRKLANGWVGRYSADYMDQVTELKRFGQKTGRGIYVYGPHNHAGKPDHEVLEIISDIQSKKDIAARSLTRNEITRRYMAAMVNEAARILEEGIVLRPLDIDVTMVHGFGFPRWRGGPMKYADLMGLTNILEDIKFFEKEDPEFWTPAPLLVDLVKRRKNFDSLNK